MEVAKASTSTFTMSGASHCLKEKTSLICRREREEEGEGEKEGK
jgi:hypothetical protein